MFVQESGRVAVVKRGEGVDHHLRDLSAGDCFGEMALIDMSPRSASVIALEDCSAIRLTNADLYRVYQADLELPSSMFAELVAGVGCGRSIRWGSRRMGHALSGPDARKAVIEIRPVFEADDFGEEFTPELRARKQHMPCRARAPAEDGRSR